MQDRRKFSRGPTFLGGRVSFNKKFSAMTMDCSIRNLSQNGAKLIFAAPVLVPTEFDIQIHTKGGSRRARIIWRNETEIGIAMGQPDLSAVIPTDTARKIRKLETDRDALQKRVAELTEPM